MDLTGGVVRKCQAVVAFGHHRSAAQFDRPVGTEGTEAAARAIAQ